MKKLIIAIIIIVIVVVLALIYQRPAEAPTTGTATTSMAISGEFGGGVQLGQ